MRNKGGCSNSENQNMYKYHSGNNLDSRQTATITTAPTATSKEVINMPSTTLTEAQKQLLAQGPNFTISTRCLPIGEYIAAVEQTCQSLVQGAEELSAEVKAVIKKIQPLRPNITREEQKAIKEMREDNTRVVLTADKRVCLVVMDRKEYINKAEGLLNQETCKIIPADPTIKQKNKLITLLKNIKAEGGIKKIHNTMKGQPQWS